MINELWKITWGSPEHIVWAPLLVGCFILLGYRFYRLRTIVSLLVVPERMKQFLPQYSSAKQIIKLILMVIGLLFLFLALLRPMWNKKEEIVEQEGRDFFVALDISRSMLATDCKPNRLFCAKEKIKKLVSLLSCDRVGLILFSGSTFVQCPLTTDYSAFYMFLDQIGVETISSGTTAIDQAIKKALESFSAMPDKKNKLLVLFTDGEDFSSNLSGIKREAAKEGMHIFTLGLGTSEGAPIPLFDDEGRQKGHQLDNKGKVVISRLNEGILHALAADSGGTYIRVKDDDADLSKLVEHIHAFEKEKIEDKKIATLEEQYPYFLLVSFICFVLEWLL